MTIESPHAEDLRMDIGALLGAIWRRAIRIAVVTVALAALTYVALTFVPKQYESSASILVEDRSSSYTQAAGAAASPSGNAAITLDSMMSSQIELIRSRDTLLAVIDSMKLQDVPEFAGGGGGNPLSLLFKFMGKTPSAPKSDTETVLQNLNDKLSVIRERDSAVISIFVRSEDPQLAARIANAVAAEHVRRRAGQSLSDTAEATGWLLQQIDTLRVKVQDADDKVANFKVANDIFTGSNNTSLADQQLSDIAKQITDAQAAKNTAQQNASLIRGLIDAGQPLDSVPGVRDSLVVQQLTQSKGTLQGELAQRSATLMPNHPTIVALRAQIAAIDRQIRDEGLKIATGLEAQVKIQTGILSSLNDDLGRAKVLASSQTKNSVTLDGLTREAKAQSDLLDSYLLRYRDASSRTDAGSTLPDVRVITEAAPAVSPAEPKVSLTVGAVGFIALALQIGAVLFGELMSGRAVYDRNSRRLTVAEPLPADEGQETTDMMPSSPIDLERMSAEMAIADPVAVEEALEADAEPEPEPEVLPEPAMPEPRHEVAAANELELANLSADIAIGRVRVVLLAGLEAARDAAIVADALVADAMRRGLSVCRVDAGSGRMSDAPGLTDLCAEDANFGDVVHKVREGLAEVPWGGRPTLERRSMKAITLVEALSDIYEAVVVVAGRVGLSSNLPVFGGIDGRLVLVRGGEAGDDDAIEAASADAAALGFETVQVIAVPERQSAVA